MKFCGNCGAQIEDNLKFCTSCGASVHAGQTSVAEKPSSVEKVMFGKKPNGKLIAIIAAAVAVVVVLCIVFIGGGGNGVSSYDDAVDLYYEMVFDSSFDIDDIEKIAPQEFLEYLDEEYEVGDGELKEKYKKYHIDYRLDEYEGDNFEFEYDTHDETEHSKNDSRYEFIAENLEKRYGIPEESIDAICEMDSRLILNGDDGEQQHGVDIIAFEIDGDWYTVNALDYLKEMATYSGYRD